MRPCPYCATPVRSTARTCAMCGNGLPVDAAASRPVLTIVLTVLVVGALFAGAFLYGKWRADVTPMSASIPAFAPRPAAKTPSMPPARPVAAEPADPAVKPQGLR